MPRLLHFYRRSARAMLALALIGALAIDVSRAADAPPPATNSVPTPTAPIAPDLESDSESERESDAESDLEAEIAALPMSNAARVRLDRARESIVQVRGFFGASQSDAFHGSGFAVTSKGLIVTNYHVVSEAVLHPNRYRLEYLAADGSTGKLRVMAIDVEHDLAVVAADGLALRPLRLRRQIPGKGERAYSIGFPLNLGLTITEGVANGLIENTLAQRIHYSGAMNGGMSGGPALDGAGAVYGVNVSVLTGGQSISFVVPAKHIDPLLAKATGPLGNGREQVAAQLLAHQTSMLASVPKTLATQTSQGYVLPAKIASAFECKSGGNADANRPLRVETINCYANMSVYVQRGLDTGDIYFMHRILASDQLHPLQFAEAVNRSATGFPWGGSADHVAPFACHSDTIALNGFDARVGICVRQYRMFAALYDFAVSITSVNEPRRAVVSNVRLRGVGYDSGTEFISRYLRTLQWTP